MNQNEYSLGAAYYVQLGSAAAYYVRGSLFVAANPPKEPRTK